jgi:murein DD-endopeptidase MepM/ murein hydrolase activator NlpD
MIDGTVTKIGYAYANALQFRYVEVTNDVFKVWLMYLEHDNLKVGQTVCAGQRVGYAMDIAKFHNSKRKDGKQMKNHLHVQIWKNGVLVDPKPYLK